MALPAIDFRNIRLHRGTRHDAFEELCCQLASLELRPDDSRHYRKGPGRDAGVECFTRFADGTETGWQVKYTWAIDALKPQLKQSLESALKNHPNLSKYIVCIPFNPSDPGGDETELKKWISWAEKREEGALEGGRDLKIELWTETEICTRLVSGDERYAGRIQFFFDQEHMAPVWFDEKLAIAREGLGERYSDENNIELNIRQNLLALARNPFLNETVQAWCDSLASKGRMAIGAVTKLCDIVVVLKAPDELADSVDQLVVALGDSPIDASSPFPDKEWCKLAIQTHKLSDAHWRYIRHWVENESIKSEASNCLTDLRDLSDLLMEIARALEQSPWIFVNNQQLLVFGEGGIGKSHLLADTVKLQISHDRPALLFLGEQFVAGEPWRQMMDRLDLPGGIQKKHFLAALDAAGQAAGVRTLLVIDALNEKNGFDIWPVHLSTMLKEIERFPHLAIVLSCRTPWLDHIIPSQLDKTKLPRLKHYGYAENGGEAARRYLKRRGMTRPGAPNMYPEFNNPLFLKTVCDVLEKEGTRTFPKGLLGVTAVFKFYHKKICSQIDGNLKLDPTRRIPATAIAELAGAMADQSKESILQSHVRPLLEDILDSQGTFERSLLFQLESEGVVFRDPYKRDDEVIDFEVRFTFQRFSDHYIAEKLLDTHLDSSNPVESFEDGKFLLSYVTGNTAWQHAGVIEALAVQLPERFDVELLDLVPKKPELSNLLQQAFKASLFWRAPERFSARAFELAEQVFEGDEFLDILISVATEPGNSYNAKYLHETLANIEAPERDAFWSSHFFEVSRDDYSPVDTLIEWAWAQGFEEIEDDRAELTAIVLTWMLSTSNRTVRDRASKALASQLSSRLHLVPELLDMFADIDDYYVLERLLASIYGALMQGMAEDDVVLRVTQSVYDAIFKNGNPPVNVLVRDNARGIHEYALHRGCLPNGIDMEEVRPPYKSPWPIEHVSDELIESYTQKWENGEIGRDEIVGSVINDGDFARYVLDYHINDWSPAPIGTDPLPTDRDILDAWLAEFDASASKAEKQAYDVVQAALLATDGQGLYANTPERKELLAAEQVFRTEIGDAKWEDYRVRAQGGHRDEPLPRPRKIEIGDGKFIEFPIDPNPPRLPAHFDMHWARRWVCKRAHDLGWSDELHGNFDMYAKQYSFDRNDHRIERIGKKYQWLALYELRARMADNLSFIKRYSDGSEYYEGEWDSGQRACDPSLLIDEKTHHDGWQQDKEAVWWMPIVPLFDMAKAASHFDWMKSDDDVVDGPDLISVHDPECGQDWLNLWGFGHWSSKDASNETAFGIDRDSWGRIQCIVVHQEDEVTLLNKWKNKRLTSPDSLDRYEFYSTKYLGEYPWHPGFDDYMDWEAQGTSDDCAVRIRNTSSDYSCGQGSFDHSINQSISVKLPAPWLIEAMGLKLSNGRDLNFVDKNKDVRFFDPSVSASGPQAALVDKDTFFDMLEREKLAAVWVIGGEKSIYGSRNGHGGRRVFTSLYHLENRKIVTFDHYVEWEEPSDEQFQK